MDSGDTSAAGAADLSLRLRSGAADSIAAALRYLGGDRLANDAVEAAAQWIASTDQWEDAFDILAVQISNTDDMPWLNQAGRETRLDVTALAELLGSAAAIARIGADRIRQARRAVLAAVDADYPPERLS